MLDIWLEPVEGEDNVYNVGRLNPAFYPEVPPTVTLTTNHHMVLPDPRYLALHAACAKVLHLSGAAELINSVIRDGRK
ncbi:hypothetical protein RSOL_014540 [Rhizoctonia solani AG-3 Rhs1AP]|uniref:Uncharacterized protein n=1 Tax=Rhizoctonia solani AG-3 Rhs1AP TaxID=1086054 RepID=X8IU35_9AGAM|nr:hypothetical protein RSOL_014540 [Rhizoctonia solani AG-3 Rhs1AP]